MDKFTLSYQSVSILPFQILCVKGVKKVENMWVGRWYGDGMRHRNYLINSKMHYFV